MFLRARYMQPTLGIFLARDPWSGDQMRPGSMNGWNYASANPVNRVDPSGKTDIWDVLATLYDGLLKSPCIQWEPFGPPLGRNAGFAYVKPGFLGWSKPNQEWDPSQLNIVERDFTSAINRFSGKKSNGGENPRGNRAFGSLPMTLAQLKVSPTYPMVLFRESAGNDGNEIAAAILTDPPNLRRRYFVVYDKLFFQNQNDLEPAQEGYLAHEIAHYWDFDGRMAFEMYEASKHGSLNWYQPPAGNSAMNPSPSEYFADGVKLYLYDELDEKKEWSDDIGNLLDKANGMGVGRDGLYVKDGQYRSQRPTCDEDGYCQVEGVPMRDIYDFVEDQFNRIRP